MQQKRLRKQVPPKCSFFIEASHKEYIVTAKIINRHTKIENP